LTAILVQRSRIREHCDDRSIIQMSPPGFQLSTVENFKFLKSKDSMASEYVVTLKQGRRRRAPMRVLKNERETERIAYLQFQSPCALHSSILTYKQNFLIHNRDRWSPTGLLWASRTAYRGLAPLSYLLSVASASSFFL
jgi:hypothetical protein